MYTLNNTKKAFTLAEVLITLAVIGVITTIVMPIMVNSAPKKKYMKFKKAHTTLGKVISELVNSDRYYKDGDLGKKYNGEWIDGKHEGDIPYFCNSFADIVSAKSVTCSSNDTYTFVDNSNKLGHVGYHHAWGNVLPLLDEQCKNAAPSSESRIVTSDDIVYYEASQGETFGINKYQIDTPEGPQWVEGEWNRLFYAVDQDQPFDCSDPSHCNGIVIIYKTFCVDIDGIPNNATKSNCVNECPFGFGIRYDGKILVGERATEWLAKDFNGKDPSEQEE